MWLQVGGGTFGRRAASGFAGGRKKSCELAEDKIRDKIVGTDLDSSSSKVD